MDKIKTNIKWSCPFAGIISGPSLCGKTSFIFEMIKHRKNLFDVVPDRVVYVYGIWQKAFENRPGIEFVSGVDSVLDGSAVFDPTRNNLLILDDVMQEVPETRRAASLFTRDMHHKNVSVWFVLQNLYKQGPSMRDIVLNCQVFVLFRSPRDVQQVRLLARQTGLKSLEKAYDLSIKEPYGYLVLNLQPRTSPKLQFQSKIFDNHRVVFH